MHTTLCIHKHDFSLDEQFLSHQTVLFKFLFGIIIQCLCEEQHIYKPNKKKCKKKTKNSSNYGIFVSGATRTKSQMRNTTAMNAIHEIY